MRREKIVVIEAISSSVNYISDIRDMGYEPILLERWVSEERREDRRKWHDNYYALNGDTMPEIIMASQSYKDILALMKKIDPILILPGADHAVYLATSLSADMGLPCNDSKNLDAMISKDNMQYALKKAGLGHIPVISLNMSGLESNSGFKITFSLIRKLIAGVTYGDLLMLLNNQVKPLIADDTWYLGGWDDYELYANEIYELLRRNMSALNRKTYYETASTQKETEGFAKIIDAVIDKYRSDGIDIKYFMCYCF